MLIKNTRPTLIDLPNGYTMQPGEEKEVSEEELAALRKHPATKIWMSPAVGFLEVLEHPTTPRHVPTSESSEAAGAELASDPVLTGETPAAPVLTGETPAAPVTPPSKWARIDAAKTMTDMELMAAADGEEDPDVMKALNSRADELNKALEVPKA